MTSCWSAWKRFPDASRGEHIEAPIGPGVFEVRRVQSGELLAFGHAASVAQALAGIRAASKPRPWSALFGREPTNPIELEYRVCGAPSKAAAKSIADGLRHRRHVYWSRLGGSAA